MLTETGKVVAIEADCVWVETIQRSACESCAAEKGCGQSILSKLAGKTTRIRVLLGNAKPGDFHLGQSVTLGIPEEVVVKGALFVYLSPIVGAVIGAWLTGGGSDIQSIAGALAGLMTGGFLVNLHSQKTRNDCRLNPVLLQGATENNVVNFL